MPDGRLAARCGMCHRMCAITPGCTGLCSARMLTRDGEFVSPYLGRFAAVAVDPVEKKPFRRWRQGTFIYSLGSVGCNALCPFCQNHALAHPDGELPLRAIPPEELVQSVRDADLCSVAYTYNEPTLQAEYIVAAAPLLSEAGIASAMVTNGMFSPDVRDALASCVEAMNIDVKTFSPGNYKKIGGDLDAVKSNVEYLLSRGVHIELTNLIVPGISDSLGDFEDMVCWISDISRDIPLHITRYFPAYKYTAPSPSAALMGRLERSAKDKLKYVYLGNM